ncbi:MAG: hypothetical protein N4A50_10315 [Vallitalea sp.]|jgi:hypothetical protein|nr:hypothetical protein [Vallitalea sp.]
MRQPKGEYGYIKSQQKVYLIGAIIGFIVMAILYCMNTFIYTEGNVLLLITVLLALPEAQFVVKLILYTRYKEGNENSYRKLEAVTDKLVYLASLGIVRGKKTLFYESIVVSDNELVLLISNDTTRKELMEYKELVDKLVRPKGYLVDIKIFNNDEDIYNYVKNQLKGKLNNIDTTKQVNLANLLLDNAI